MSQPDPSELSHDALVGIVRAYPLAIDKLRSELDATRKELDRALAEIVRLRTDLVDMNDRRNKPKED